MAAPLPKKELEDFAETYRGNLFNLNQTSRELGISYPAAQRRLRLCIKKEILRKEDQKENRPQLIEDVLGARARKQAAFEKKKRKGNWDKPVFINLPHRPFRLKVFGDPHMDSNAFDIDLWEKHWMEMDAANGVYGVCIGDWFNNWLRVLGHLWKHEGDPDDAWILFEHYMEERGNALLAACSGNHDDWSHGPADPIDMMMKRYGVVYRKGAVRVFLNAGGEPLRLALRHKWKGHSQFSPAHGLRKAAADGWADHLMVGGHTHQDEPRMYVQPRSNFISHLCQISAFKKFDDFADVHGFKPHSISPVWDYVIDPRRDDSDPDKFKVFWDSDMAAKYLEAIR